MNRNLWSRMFAWAGFLLMLIGAVDPLECSVLILAGAGMAAAGAALGGSRFRKLLAWAFGLVVTGVGIMFGMTAIGGLGGDTGRSMWWALLLVPYPVGWVLGIVGSIRRLLELRNRGMPSSVE
ncbi:hypothetical protein GX411_06140 [Candidatus Fermentibacteria bacterium]|nr:hypothetical protein [Candidatus Fermentibacteria bacterium]